MTDELANVVFSMQGDQISNSEYGLFVSNSARDTMALDALKQLTHAALQNDQISLSDVISIYNSNSLSDTRVKLKKAEKENDQKQAEQQQQQMQMQQQQQQMQMQFEIEKENREDARNSEDNSTKLEIARMGAQSKNMDRDLNNNQIRDDIDLAKLQLEREKLQANTSIKQRELNIKDKDAETRRNSK